MYGFQPKQFDVLMDELKRGNKNLKEKETKELIAKKEDKEKEQAEKNTVIESTQFGQKIDPQEKLQIMFMALAVSLVGTFFAHFMIHM